MECFVSFVEQKEPFWSWKNGNIDESYDAVFVLKTGPFQLFEKLQMVDFLSQMTDFLRSWLICCQSNDLFLEEWYMKEEGK